MAPSDQTETEAHWASCLVVVLAYDDIAPAVSASVRQAMERLSLAPALDDFIELRFVDAGPRPDQDAEPDSLGSLVVDEVTRPTRGAPENYFGLVVVDDRAEDVADLLGLCGDAVSPHELGVLSKGFAVKMPGRNADEPPAQITILGSRPHLEDRLAAGIRDFCEHLMERYAGGARKGVSTAALAAIRAPEVVAASEQVQDETFAALSATVASNGVGSGDTNASLGRADAQPSVARPPADAKRKRPSDPQHGGSATPVFIAPVGMHSGGRSDWRRVRSLVRRLDDRLAEESEGSQFFVGLVPAQSSVRMALQPAGGLRRRDLPRPNEFGDFAQHLDGVRKALERGAKDLARRGHQPDRPTVLFLSIGAPVGDAISTELYREVSSEASIVWVLIGEAGAPLPPGFADDAIVIPDHAELLDELVEHVTVRDAVVGLSG